MSPLNEVKSMIHTIDGGELPPDHKFHDLVDRTIQNILRCEPLLNNYADNTFKSLPDHDRDKRTRVREIRRYLNTYPPTINLVSLAPNVCAETPVEHARSPVSGRTHWNLVDHPNRQFSACHIKINVGIVDALEESKDKDNKFRLLSGLLIILIVHEIAHVIHATFADIPTPNRIGGDRGISPEAAYDESRTEAGAYIVGEAGDYAENVISGNRGEFWASYGTSGDYESIESLEIRGRYQFDDYDGKRKQLQCSIGGASEVLNELIEGRWPPRPLPDQTLPNVPNPRAKKASAYHDIVRMSDSTHPRIPREIPETPTPYLEKSSGSIVRNGMYYRR